MTAVRKKDTRTRPRVSKLCVYCRMRIANNLVKLNCGGPDGVPSSRWMCGMCVFKRQRLGIITTNTNNQYERVR